MLAAFGAVMQERSVYTPAAGLWGKPSSWTCRLSHMLKGANSPAAHSMIQRSGVSHVSGGLARLFLDRRQRIFQVLRAPLKPALFLGRQVWLQNGDNADAAHDAG